MRILRILPRKLSRIGVMLAVIAVLLVDTPLARASAGNNALKIYEVAGAGGLAGATYRQDTIVLFNPTQATISCKTCAIQTHSGTSNTSSWTVYKLPSLSIPAGGFYMVSASSPTLSTAGSLSPIPYDYRLKTIEGTVVDGTSGDNILSSTVGVIALTSTQSALTAGSDSLCGTGNQLLDFVGYGSDIATNSSTTATPASCYAGSSAAYYDGSAAYGRELGVARKNKCIDTFDNANDFVNTEVTYFNGSSPVSPCPTGSQLSATVSTTPTNPGVLESVTFKAVVSGATQPSSTGITASLDFGSPYYSGSLQRMYDDGTHGDGVAGDGTFTLTTTVPAGVDSGFVYPTNVTITDALGNSYTGSTRLNVASGTIAMSTPSTTGTISSGGVLTFPITITGQHGYGGILNISCAGSPNANSLGVPISTQCVSTPPEITLSNNGNSTISLAVATGTTHSASLISRSPLAAMGLFSAVLFSFGVLRHRRLSSVGLLMLIAMLTLNIAACGTNAGLGNTGAAPGTYTYTVTATDSNISTVTNSLILTINVQ